MMPPTSGPKGIERAANSELPTCQNTDDELYARNKYIESVENCYRAWAVDISADCRAFVDETTAKHDKEMKAVTLICDEILSMLVINEEMLHGEEKDKMHYVTL